MKKTCDILKSSQMFRELEQDQYASFCSDSLIQLFWKGELIVHEGDLCPGVIVILEGQASIQKTAADGEYTTLALLEAGDSFGEELIFGRSHRYQLSLEAASNGKYIIISREKLLRMIQDDPRLLSNILSSLSLKIQKQDRLLNLLSQRSLRDKISVYLVELLRSQLSADGKSLADELQLVSTPAVELPVSKEMVARLLAMPRPSFSRELINMERDGLIHVSGRVIWLLDLETLSSGEIVDL